MKKKSTKPSKERQKILKPKLNTGFGGKIDKTSYRTILLLIFCLILFFAFAFWGLDTWAPGQGTNKSNEDLTFWDYIYFSVTTFSTLGYGDISPIGFGRIFTILEVLMGMVLFAIFIGKISSERQSSKIQLIYSAINHQKILTFLTDLSDMREDLDTVYKSHENEKLLTKSQQAYNFASVIKSYLILQSLEGELADFGNESTLRRLYRSLNKIQQTVATIMKTRDIPKNTKTHCLRTINTISEIGQTMQQFHVRNEKIMGLLREIVSYGSLNNSISETIIRTEITKELLEVVSSYKNKYEDLSLHSREIAEDLGMTYKLCKRCIDQINSLEK